MPQSVFATANTMPKHLYTGQSPNGRTELPCASTSGIARRMNERWTKERFFRLRTSERISSITSANAQTSSAVNNLVITTMIWLLGKKTASNPINTNAAVPITGTTDDAQIQLNKHPVNQHKMHFFVLWPTSGDKQQIDECDECDKKHSDTLSQCPVKNIASLFPLGTQ